MPAPLHLSNPLARRLFLDRSGLSAAPAGEDLLGLIQRLGFVQVDSINTVERAHHMILFARRPAYRPAHLKPLLEKHRTVFEHWTHDASIIPTASFPHWHLRFARDVDRLRDRWETWQRNGFADKFDAVLARINEHGPTTSSDVGIDEARASGGWWNWHPSKTALEYHWRTGALSVLRRDGFQKVYDLTERVIHPDHLAVQPEPQDTIDWACNSALDRLGFATSGELAAFFATVTPPEAAAWCKRALAAGEIVEIDLITADGAPRRSFARPDVLEQARDAAEPPTAIRILSPFDPALRDRNRAERLFGFHYRIEVFVPAPKRKYGYYVFPVLQGDKLIGRIDMKRTDGVLQVTGYWPEPGQTLTKVRLARLDAALARIARFAGCPAVVMADGWLRTG